MNSGLRVAIDPFQHLKDRCPLFMSFRSIVWTVSTTNRKAIFPSMNFRGEKKTISKKNPQNFDFKQQKMDQKMDQKQKTMRVLDPKDFANTLGSIAKITPCYRVQFGPNSHGDCLEEIPVPSNITDYKPIRSNDNSNMFTSIARLYERWDYGTLLGKIDHNVLKKLIGCVFFVVKTLKQNHNVSRLDAHLVVECRLSVLFRQGVQ